MPDMFDVEPEKKVLCHSRSHLSAPNRPFFGSSETFSLGRMRLCSVSYSLREKHTENIYLKKKITF